MGATTRVRLRFAKEGDLRLVSHHDLMRCLERMLRRADLPVAHTQGFNPRPKFVFALALALGIEGRREVLELELTAPLEPSEVLRRLAACAPAGFTFLEAEAAGPGRPPAPRAVRYRVPIPPERRDDARAALSALLASDRWPYTRRRPDRTAVVDLRPFLLGAELGPEGPLRFRMKIDPAGSARPEELLEALGLRDLLDAGAVLVREDIELADRDAAAVGAAASPRDPTFPATDRPDHTRPTPRATTPEDAPHEERNAH